MTITIEVLGYWGFPGTLLFIYFWSIPLILALALLFKIFNRNRQIVFWLLVASSLATISNQIMLEANNNECVGVIADSVDPEFEGISPSLMRNVTEDGHLVPLSEARIEIAKESLLRKWLISLVATPSLRPEWLFQKAATGEYYLFAEHDNLTSFIGEKSPFNPDSFRRTGPWDTYKPVMALSLFQASKGDPLYCSNIGCTLRRDLNGYPLVWDYTRFGTPVLLVKGMLDKGRRFVFIGDSDPSANFLAPYNTFWLRSLLGIPNHFEFANAALIILIASLTLCRTERKAISIATISVCFLLCIIGGWRRDFKPSVDVSISSTDKWRSPHYSSHFSSLPRELAKEHLIVSIERNEVDSKMDIKIVTHRKYRMGGKPPHHESRVRM